MTIYANQNVQNKKKNKMNVSWIVVCHSKLGRIIFEFDSLMTPPSPKGRTFSLSEVRLVRIILQVLGGDRKGFEN